MKTLSEIKFGERVFTHLIDPAPVTYDQILHGCGLSPKQVQKALADLCKAGYIHKDNKGMYLLTENGLVATIRIQDAQETVTGS